MLRRLAISIGVCVAFIAARADNVGTSYTLTANGTNKVTQALTNVAASPTNFVNLSSVFVTVPANSTGVVEVATHIGGVLASPTFTVTLVNKTAAPSVRFIEPRKEVTSASTPAVAPYPLYGTNSLLSVTQAGPATNSWAVTVLSGQ